MGIAATITLATTVGTTVIGPGNPTVLIGGKPACVMGDMTTPMPATGAPGTFAMGSTTVLIGNMGAIRTTDTDTNGGMAVPGEPTVMIG